MQQRPWWHAAGALLVAGAALASLAYTLSTGHASFLAFYLVSLLLGLALVRATANGAWAQQAYFLFLVVFSVNVCLVLVFAELFAASDGLPFVTAPPGVIPDDERFYEYGLVLAEAWQRGVDAELPLGVKFLGYPYFLGACIYVSSFFGDLSPVSPRLLNAMFGALLPVTVYRIAALVYIEKKVARTAMILTASFPVFAYYSAMLFRDIFVAYLIALAVLIFLEVASKESSKDKLALSVPLVAACLAVLLMRDLSAIVLVASFAFYAFLRQSRWAKAAMVFVALAVIIQLLSMIDLDSPRAQMYLTYSERAADVFERTAAEGSLGMRYIIGAPFPLNFVLRVPYSALVPVPPLIAVDFPNLVRGSGALIWYFMFPLWIYGMWASRHNRNANLLSVISLVFLLGISLVSIDLRHKTQYLAFAMIHVSFAAHALGERTRRVVVATFLVLGFLGIAYGYLRFAA